MNKLKIIKIIRHKNIARGSKKGWLYLYTS